MVYRVPEQRVDSFIHGTKSSYDLRSSFFCSADKHEKFAIMGKFFVLVAGRSGERKEGERKEEGKKKRRKREKEINVSNWIKLAQKGLKEHLSVQSNEK